MGNDTMSISIALLLAIYVVYLKHGILSILFLYENFGIFIKFHWSLFPSWNAQEITIGLHKDFIP